MRKKLKRPWYYTDWEPELHETATIGSGTASGTSIGVVEASPIGGRGYDGFEWFLTGTDAVYFATTIQDDDNDPNNGYTFQHATARPLPAREYQLREHSQLANAKPCDHRKGYDDPGYISWIVTVTAPAGTLHEAFFDPVAIGTALGADATNGVLKSADLTVGGVSTHITGLKWENNQVELTLYRHATLRGYALDFIALDGSVSLTLKVSEGTVDAETGTLTWAREAAPWQNGDKLMLRIRQDG